MVKIRKRPTDAYVQASSTGKSSVEQDYKTLAQREAEYASTRKYMCVHRMQKRVPQIS
jgi:hypothetical protein